MTAVGTMGVRAFGAFSPCKTNGPSDANGGSALLSGGKALIGVSGGKALIGVSGGKALIASALLSVGKALIGVSGGKALIASALLSVGKALIGVSGGKALIASALLSGGKALIGGKALSGREPRASGTAAVTMGVGSMRVGIFGTMPSCNPNGLSRADTK